MNKIKKEFGSSLLIVLLTITIFSIIGVTILSVTINSAKQINYTENKVHTTDIAEMGIQIYFNAMENIEGTIEKDVANDIKQKIEEKIEDGTITDLNKDGFTNIADVVHSTTLKNQMYEFGFKRLIFYLLNKNLNNIDTNLEFSDLSSGAVLYDEVHKIKDFSSTVTSNSYRYKVDTNVYYTISNFFIKIDKTNKIVKLSYSSTGEISNKKSKSLSTTFTIHLKPINYFNPENTGDGPPEVITETQQITGNSSLTINGDATFNSTVTLGGNGRITIYGSGDFQEQITIHGGGNDTPQLCVYGTLTASSTPEFNGNSDRIIIFAENTSANLDDVDFISTNDTAFNTHCPAPWDLSSDLDMNKDTSYVNY